jgi:hypothetical protein
MKFPKDPQRNKKKKQKQPDKKPRTVTHPIVFGVDDIPEGTRYIPLEYHHNLSTGETTAFIAGKEIKPNGLEMLYDRPGKTSKKVLRMEDSGTTNNFDVLIKKYSLLVAIDTNTATIGGTTYHVGYACHTVLNEKKEIEKVHPFPGRFILTGEVDNPEFKNIRSLIQALQQIKFDPVAKFEDHFIGIITDHDLINHSAINKRNQPLIEDYYVPENVELIYAFDGSADTVFNKMIMWCHKQSTDLFKKSKPQLEKLTNY